MYFGIILVSLFLVASVTAVHALTSEEVEQWASWSSSIDNLFDSQGNLIDVQKYDYGFIEISQRFQSFSWPVKSILNNQRIQVNFKVTPSITKQFGIVIKDEEVRSFTLGELSNSTMEIDLDAATYEESREKLGFEAALPQYIKDGRIKIVSKDFFHGIMIGIYKIFI